ncbi:homeobox KN domain-containing protein, partial [Chlamydoabsidia padenii]
RKRRGNLPKTITCLLKEWLVLHADHPYPSDDEKSHLQRETNLTINQISNWFINARRRLLPYLINGAQSMDHRYRHQSKRSSTGSG